MKARPGLHPVEKCRFLQSKEGDQGTIKRSFSILAINNLLGNSDPLQHKGKEFLGGSLPSFFQVGASQDGRVARAAPRAILFSQEM
jgi:hypothetical protein